jgi:CheY-like chemotaxis protein
MKERIVTSPQIATWSQAIVPRAVLQVLILDDERFDRHRLARLCSSLDLAYEITNATSLGEFQTLITQGRFNLVLIDYRLPDGTGIEALRMVNMSVENHNAATIMITGQGQANIAEAAINRGCCDYLTKDNLCATTFSRSVHSALHRPRLSRPKSTNAFPEFEVEAFAGNLASKCANDMKPMVSRMMRHVRDLRKQHNAGVGETPPRIGAIGDSCVNIWEFLVALERSSRGELLAEVLQDENAKVKRTKRSQLRKPPSPFTKISH